MNNPSQQQLNIIERLEIGSNNLELNQNSSQGFLTDDGKYLVFVSEADNLVTNDNNRFPDIFIYDRDSKTTERVSVSTDGFEANSFSKQPVVSNDGRYIVFVSEANNLVTNDVNKSTDIFIYDRDNKTTERISVNSNGVEAESYSFAPSISNDGRYIAYESDANNLVSNDNNNNTDVFIRDRDSNTTEIISVSSDNVLGNNRSKDASVSGDGRYIAYESDADNLVSNDNNNDTDIFIRDRDSNTTEIISVSTEGLAGNGYSFDPAISGDGRYVVFESKASNLVGDDTNNKTDIFIRDRQESTTKRISLTANSTQANDDSVNPAISDDGRYVVFESKASNLVADDTNVQTDIFVRDLLNGTVERVNVDSNGVQGNAKSYGASISNLGEYITFTSEANNLTAADNNDAKDIFIREYSGLLNQQDLSKFDTSNVHRFYEPTKGNHFYTADDNEINIIRSKSEAGELSYQYESAKFTVLTDDKDVLTGEKIAESKPVYRFFNDYTGAHFYTMDENEKNALEDNNYGYSFEGIKYYAFESPLEEFSTIPVYRMLNSQSGTHLFTVDINEIDYLQNNAPQYSLENSGEAAFYVFEL